MDTSANTTKMQSQAPRLASLPLELLSRIAAPLPTKDFNALRLTCRWTEDKLFPYWANCFFKKKQFMMDQFSLQTLVDISQHHALSKIITHLIIGLDEYAAISSASLMHDMVEYGQWRAAVAGQQNLMQTGIAVDLLSSALAKLPNLKTIDIRDFNSPTRYRDAIGQQRSEWHSYGSSSYRQWKDKHSRPKNLIFCSTEFTGQVFKALLSALDRCSPQLDSLEVITRNRDCALNDDALAFSPALGTGLTRTLQHLTKLHFDLSCQDPYRHQPPFVRAETSDFGDAFDPLTAYTRGFLAHTKNVTWLRLNFDQVHVTSTRLLKWLSLNPDCDPQSKHLGWDEMNPAPVVLPLRRLDLGMITVQPDVLHRVLAKFPDLENLSLRHAVLELKQGLASREMLDENGTYEDGDCVWAKFIRGLSVSTPSLKHLTLVKLQQVSRPYAQDIIFCMSESYLSKTSDSTTDIDNDRALQQLADVTWTLASFDRLCKVETGIDTGEDSDVIDNSDAEHGDTSDLSIADEAGDELI